MFQIDCINVGSGDAALVRVNDYAALVDCGNVSLGECRPGSQRIMAADFLREEGVTRLDLVVLTHLHRDHIGGFQAVLEAVRVDEIWTNYLPAPALWGCLAEVPEGAPKKARGLCKSLALYLPALRMAQEQGAGFREVTRPAKGVPLTEGLTADIGCLPEPYYRRQSRVLDEALRGRPDPAEMDAVGAALNEASIRLRLNFHGQAICCPATLTGQAGRRKPRAARYSRRRTTAPGNRSTGNSRSACRRKRRSSPAARIAATDGLTLRSWAG